MSFATNLRCRECGRNTRPRRATCATLLRSARSRLRLRGDAPATSPARRSSGPAPALALPRVAPIDGEHASTRAGFTPLVRANNLGKVLGLRNLWIKNDTVNPTFSFKDRVVTVASTSARELGFDILACASHRQPGRKRRAHAAAAGMRASSSSRAT